MKKTAKKVAKNALLILIAVIVFYPVYQMVILSVLPREEIVSYIAAVENPAYRFAPGYFFPRAFSPEQIRAALTPAFLRAFYISFVYTVLVVVLQFVVAFVSGFVFAKTTFKGRDILFFLYLAAMVLPFHVTVVPLNQILHRVNLFDTPWAVILPAVFSPLGVFLFRQFIQQVPDEVLEAATLDGAGLFCILKNIVLPIIKGGAAMFFLLTMVMQWAAIEPALAFIRAEDLRPVSLYLRELMNTETALIFAPSVLYMLPVILAVILLVKPTANS
ncbi:MAG: carbohydrate ABC transporter permease [Defluviitaleaceae bacterium]|nr:carbohydrate ABC transporter permease [Defluviitaleaceae bacterium]